MALARTFKQGLPRKQGGQGAVEAILALPALLLFVCFVFQLFLLGIAQVQLQYAAFYAARVGAVRNQDKKEMELTVKRILGQFPGLEPLSKRYFRIEILDTEDQGKPKNSSQTRGKQILKVRVHWQYPLTVPIADAILKTRNPISESLKPCIHLRASWAMPNFASRPGEDGYEDDQST